MKGYRYSGPTSGATLSGGTEILSRPGETVPLSEGHNYVKVLVALKHLTSEPEDTKSAVTLAAQSLERRNSSDNEVKTEDVHGG